MIPVSYSLVQVILMPPPTYVSLHLEGAVLSSFLQAKWGGDSMASTSAHILAGHESSTHIQNCFAMDMSIPVVPICMMPCSLNDYLKFYESIIVAFRITWLAAKPTSCITAAMNCRMLRTANTKIASQRYCS